MALTELPNTDRLGDAVYNRIRDAIISGELKPGTPLRVPAIAQDLGVSRSPVREAIIRLTGERLAHSEPRLGAMVAKVKRQDLADLYEIREVLEGLAARLAAASTNFGPIADLKEILHKHDNAVSQGNIDEHIELDLSFHRLVRQMAGNKELELLLNHIESQVRLAMLTITVSSGPHIALGEHKSIYKAIQSRDPNGAEKAARAHIARLHDTLMNETNQTIQAEIQ
jgi:DNA-binding GntR family transcriptional regulator